MTSTAFETALMMHVEQITDGEPKCCYCDRIAAVTFASGADPDPETVCGVHGARLIASTLHFVTTFLTPPDTA